MDDDLEGMKRRSYAALFSTLAPTAKCPFTKQQLRHAAEQALGVMEAYMQSRGQAGIDAHQFKAFVAVLSVAIETLSSEGPGQFIKTYAGLIRNDNTTNMRNFPLLKGMETLTHILDININPPLREKLERFDQWRKKGAGAQERDCR